MLVYGRASETERVWVVNEGVGYLKRLKIQSIPVRKRIGIECLQQLNTQIYVIVMPMRKQNIIKNK
jgi:hypothetical protein